MAGNIARAKEAYALFSRGEMDAFFKSMSDDVEFVYYGEVPWARHFKGKAEVAKFFEAVGGLNFEEYEQNEYFEDGDTVIVLGRTASTVKATGARFDNHWVNVLTIWDEKLRRLVGYDTASIAKSR